MKRIYISGPMSGMPEHNFPAFNAEAARLRAKDREAEYRASARRCDERIAEWKAQLGITSTKGARHG